ncbi:MAG TPA: aminotransferase class V-fold PLP-dependent enzyme [Planctomycetota bacterium]|nr:aminotransferase class V-fold PLP-dependent enzyme [Planctomycetota bacterium]
MEPSRRDMLRGAFGAVALAVLGEAARARAQDVTKAASDRTPEAIAQDEEFWAIVRSAFTLDPTITNLNNGGVSPSPRVVQDAMRRYLEQSNGATAHTMWRVLEPQVEDVRKRLAATFGCDPEELAITRNTSESLETVQFGLDLKPGDEVLTTNQDYPRMLAAWKQRERREGIVLKTISFPVPPPSPDDLVSRFEKAITAKTRVILFCHITNRTGQIFPVKKICQMARQKGIETIVDGAHAFAQFPFKRDDLDCDYYGTSLHKWLMAPHGTGFLYVRREKIKSLWPLMAAGPDLDGNIRKFEEIGTHPAANHNAIADALTFHEALKVERKAARLRYLRERWSRRLEALKGAKILTSSDPAQSCGLGMVSFAGVDHGKLANTLLEKHRILVTFIESEEYAGLRVTPSVYSTLAEVDAFCAAVEKELG